MRTLIRWAALAAAVLMLVLVPVTAAAQAAGASIGSGVLTGIAPIATVLLTSGITWVANQMLGAIRDWSHMAKYAFMGVVGVVVSVVFAAIGHTIPSDASTWTALTAQGAAAAAVAALVFKIGKGD